MPSFISSLSSFSLKTWLPMILIWLILEVSPSTTLNTMATRLRSNSVTTVLTLTEYLPRATYARFSSCSALSRADLSKIRPSTNPTNFKLSFSVSLGKSFTPLISMLAIDGRSITLTIKASCSLSSFTSLKNPVANNARIAEAACSLSSFSPTLTGR